MQVKIRMAQRTSVRNLKILITQTLVPTVEKCQGDLEKFANDIHLSSRTEKITRVASSSVGLVGAALAFFPPTAVVGVPILAGSAIAGVGSCVGGFVHQKGLYEDVVKRVRESLGAEISIVEEKVIEVLEMWHEHDGNDLEKEEIQILYGLLRCTAALWDPSLSDEERQALLADLRDGVVEEDKDQVKNPGDENGKEDKAKNKGGSKENPILSSLSTVGRSAPAAASIGGAAIKATALTGKVLKVSRMTAIKDAIQAFKAARAAGGATGIAARASAVRNAIAGVNAARSTATMASRAFAGVGAVLGVAALAWDSYELHADNPTRMEEDCLHRREQLKQIRDHLKTFCKSNVKQHENNAEYHSPEYNAEHSQEYSMFHPKPESCKENTFSDKTGKMLLVGCSQISALETLNQRRLNVLCVASCDLENFITSIDKLPSDFEVIFLVAGSKDNIQKECSVESFLTKLQNIINVAKQHAQKVVVSSILPQGTRMENKIYSINTQLKSMCDVTKDCEFVDQDKTFKLADGTQNENLYMKDLITWSLEGTNKLIQNLGLTGLVKQKPYLECNYEAEQNMDMQDATLKTQELKLGTQLKKVHQEDKLKPPFAHHTRTHYVKQNTVRKAKKPSFNKYHVCSYCGEPNHESSFCGHGRPVKCNKCGRYGHKAKFCTF